MDYVERAACSWMTIFQTASWITIIKLERHAVSYTVAVIVLMAGYKCLTQRFSSG